MRDSNAPKSKLPGTLTRFSTLWVGLILVAVLFITSIVKGQFGDIGPDSDDVLRLVQIRDFLGLQNGEGQNWFDTTQYRLGPADGTNMHWSRIPDIPLIILTAIFDVFMDTETALRWAYLIWPPFSSLILVFALAKGARYWSVINSSNTHDLNFGNDKTYVFTLVLLAFFVSQFYRFVPGAIDHHNIQIGLIALAMAFALDPKSRFVTFALSGFATAISIAVGVEVYIFAAIICGFMALNWLVRGGAVAMGTQGFGFGLAGGLALAFFGTIAPAEYGIVACDALSLITLSIGSIGAIGLALAAKFLPQESFKLRFIALSAAGIVCLLILSRQAPECLSNPLNTLSDDVDRLWLNQIEEAKPISLSMKDALTEIPYMLGAPLLALIILCHHFWRSREWSAHALILLLLLAALGLTVYQQRFYPFAYVVALLPLAGFISRMYQRGVAKVEAYKGDGAKPSNISYIGALALSIPLIWAVPGFFLEKDNASSVSNSTSQKAEGCYSTEVMDALNTLPVGLIAATSDGGAPILQFTQHRALSGNYHRNMAGIEAQIKIATSEPNEALSLLRQNGVNYVHFCNPSEETENLTTENSDGLYGQLKTGMTPKGLVRILPEIGDNVIVSIYRVTD